MLTLYQEALEQSPEHILIAESAAITDVSLLITGLTPSNEDYYPTIVVSTLMSVIRDQSLTHLHATVIDAVMNIYTTLGLKCVPFLGKVIPGFLEVLRNSAQGREEGYFNQLAVLVRTVRQHIRPFLPQITQVLSDLWPRVPSAHATMLSLIESIARCLEGEFKVFLAPLLPHILGVLDQDQTPRRAASERVLHAFLVFGSSAEEYMHLILPVIIRMFERQNQSQSIRKAAIETIGKLTKKVNISDFASRIIHPLSRVIAGNDVVLRHAALETLTALVFQLGPDYLIFIPMINKVIFELASLDM